MWVGGLFGMLFVLMTQPFSMARREVENMSVEAPPPMLLYALYEVGVSSSTCK